MRITARRAIIAAFVFLVLLSAMAAFFAVRAQGKQRDDLGVALQVMALVKTKYVDPVSLMDLVSAYSKQGSIAGMLKTLNDPYTRYMNKADYASFTEQTEGTFAGIGVTVDLKGDYVVVGQPFKGTPGEKAGLLPGDLIIAVDGKSTKNMALDAAVSLIRGPAGTTVVLTIERTSEGRVQTMEVRIKRAIIHVPTVEYEVLKDKAGPIGLVSIMQFSRGTSTELRDALAELRASGVKGLILDLRYNPGGLLDEAISVCAQFLSGGKVLSVVDRSRTEQPLYAQSYKPFGGPIVMLVNEWSASASEITAGALQDRKIATLVGVKTFGKGVVQTVFPIAGGGGLSLTTSRYLTAGGRAIHKIGIEPDVRVELPEGSKTDVQFDKALEVLREKMARAAVGGR